MKNLTSKHFLNELKDITYRNVRQLEEFSELDEQTLNYTGISKSWSINQCIEHLKRYFDFYIPELNKRILINHSNNNKYFKSGWLGNYFTNSVKLNSGNSTKMKTMKNMDPTKFGSVRVNNIITCIGSFYEFVNILEKCSGLDLEKIKTKISLTSLIRLRLGDTLQFVTYHNDRHINQAIKKLKEQEINKVLN